MNIFVLDLDTAKAASYHNDKHCVKMILESAQMLSTAQRYFNKDIQGVYKQSHLNHPCNIWIRKSTHNYLWLYSLYENLAEQYSLRFFKQHRSYYLLKDKLIHPPDDIPNIGLTDFALAMPDQYKCKDPVRSYRSYYIGDKLKFSSWRHPSCVPYWIPKIA